MIDYIQAAKVGLMGGAVGLCIEFIKLLHRAIAANRAALTELANNPSATLGQDQWGNTWAAITKADGSQLWVQTRQTQIINGGLNQTPISYNPTTGLSGPRIP